MLIARISQSEYDSLPDSDKAHYKGADGGHFVLDVKPAGGLALENVQNLKRTVEVERSRADEATKKLDLVSKHLGEDADPADVKARLDEFEKLKATDGDREKQIDERVKTQVAATEARFTKKITDLETKNKQLEEEGDRDFRGAQISEALSARGIKGRLVRNEVEKRTKLVRADDGSRVVRVFDRDGKEQYNDRGDRATLENLLHELENDEETAMHFPAREGSGSAGSKRGDASTPGQNGSVRRVDMNRAGTALEDIASGKAVINR